MSKVLVYAELVGYTSADDYVIRGVAPDGTDTSMVISRYDSLVWSAGLDELSRVTGLTGQPLAAAASRILAVAADEIMAAAKDAVRAEKMMHSRIDAVVGTLSSAKAASVYYCARELAKSSEPAAVETDGS